MGREPFNFGLYSVLTLLLASATGYLVWQIGSLVTRVDQLGRQVVSTRDELVANNEKLVDQLARLQEALIADREASVAPPPAAGATADSPQSGSASASTDGMQLHFRFLETHLALADAVIAERLYLGAPLDVIAQQTNHSRGFVIIRGNQIVKVLSANPKTPAELLTTLRSALNRIKGDH